MEKVQNNVEETINSLCEWVKSRVEKGTSSEEIRVLPEVVKGVAELYKSAMVIVVKKTAVETASFKGDNINGELTGNHQNVTPSAS